MMVVMYIDSVEVIAENSGQDAMGKARICRVMFYNSLQGKAKDWFDDLEMNIQMDWNLLRDAFIDRFQKRRVEDQNEEYFIDQMQILHQGNRPITEYIKHAESLFSLIKDQSLLWVLARNFINGLSDNINQRIIFSQLPTEGFTLQKPKR
ncbi:MAG: hypothetical protein M1840_001982 [Geoglossum simile]|nr:MAG: hypothetical protein M1840_001982 [Geoglossum simile]